jgi:hypothetical protein
MELTCLARSVCNVSEPAPSAVQQSVKPESKRARLPENVDGEFYVGVYLLASLMVANTPRHH